MEPKSQLFLTDMCRVCMVTSGNIKKSYTITPRIGKMLNICTQINVSKNDCLPGLICSTCYERLNDAFQFRCLCIKSNRTLLKYVSKMLNSSVCNKAKASQLVVHVLKEELININTEEVSKTNDTCSTKLNNTLDTDDCIENNRANPIVDKNLNGRNSNEDYSTSEIFQALGLMKVKDRHSNLNNVEGNVNKCCRPREHKHKNVGFYSDRQFVCTICSEKFTKPILLKKHNAVHENVYNYRCVHCVAQFKTLLKLRIHTRKKHTKLTPYECRTCKKCFNFIKDYKQHVRNHFKLPQKKYHRFNCNACCKGFEKHSDLIRHLQVHDKDKPYKCRICFGEKHRNIHIDFKALRCDICYKLFDRDDTLKQHKIKHSGLKLHQCKECGKDFDQFYKLKVHLKNHPRV